MTTELIESVIKNKIATFIIDRFEKNNLDHVIYLVISEDDIEFVVVQPMKEKILRRIKSLDTFKNYYEKNKKYMSAIFCN